MKFKVIAAAVAVSLCSTASYAVLKGESEVKDGYIIIFSDSTTESRAAEIAKEVAKGKGVVGHRYRSAVKGISVTMPLPALNGLKKRFPEIEWIEPDIILHAMPRGGKPDRGGNNDGPTDTVNGNEVTPWGVIRLGGPRPAAQGLKAWVLDTGIDANHQDLNVHTEGAISFIAGEAATDDGNGHGTHVAGTIGALQNDLDVVGVAPGVPVVPVKVLSNSGSGSLSGVIAGIDYVGVEENAGDCANLSLGAAGDSLAMELALQGAADNGVNFAIAAGNSGADIARYTPAEVQYANVYTVAAIDNSDNPPRWSNFHTNNSVSSSGVPTYVEYALPGVDVVSTKSGGGVVTYSGTSMAAPHLCGLLLSGYVASDDGKSISTRKKRYGVVPNL